MAAVPQKIRLEMEWSQFIELMMFSLENQDVPEMRRLSTLIENKVRSMTEHDLYTTYKTATSEEEKEKARKEYLESRGIPSSFRW